ALAAASLSAAKVVGTERTAKPEPSLREAVPNAGSALRRSCRSAIPFWMPGDWSDEDSTTMDAGVSEPPPNSALRIAAVRAAGEPGGSDAGSVEPSLIDRYGSEAAARRAIDAATA